MNRVETPFVDMYEAAAGPGPCLPVPLLYVGSLLPLHKLDMVSKLPGSLLLLPHPRIGTLCLWFFMPLLYMPLTLQCTPLPIPCK